MKNKEILLIVPGSFWFKGSIALLGFMGTCLIGGAAMGYYAAKYASDTIFGKNDKEEE